MSAGRVVRFGERGRDEHEHYGSWRSWRGDIRVGGVEVAGPISGPAREVRRRTPDEWWLRAAEILDAEACAISPLGPMGDAVVGLLEDAAVILPPEALQRIAYDACEAGREVIFDGAVTEARDFLRQMTETRAQTSTKRRGAR